MLKEYQITVVSRNREEDEGVDYFYTAWERNMYFLFRGFWKRILPTYQPTYEDAEGKIMKDEVHTTMAHELGHALDYKVDQKLIDQKTINELSELMNKDTNYKLNRKYYSNRKEITARMFEQYIAEMKGNTEIRKQTAQWSKEVFEEKVKPAVEKAIRENLGEYLAKPKPSLPLSQKSEVKYKDIKDVELPDMKNKSLGQILEIKKQKGVLDFIKLQNREYLVHDNKGFSRLFYDGKWKQDDSVGNIEDIMKTIKDKQEVYKDGLDDIGLYNTKEDFDRLKTMIDFYESKK